MSKMKLTSEGSEPDETDIADLDVEDSTSASASGSDAEADDAENDDDDPEGDDESDDASDADDDHDLGHRAKTRIDKLLQRSKSAEAEVGKLQKELETARKLSGDDGKSYLAAAEKSGILPGLMTKDEAAAFSDLENIPAVVKSYKRWLRDHEKGDTLEIKDGKTMSFGDVEERLEDLQERFEDLKDKYGERRNELKATVKSIFELGMQAQKAGWKPGEKKAVQKPKLNKPADGITPKPTKRKPNVEDIDVTNADDLESYMTASRRNRRS